ncbi:MAG: hypothetical protein KBH81_08480 [Phycisphaerae bacterium]|jgi:hypothetical protein|nr:hypothetical protein [Phycisphaerae bacterium]HRT41173.1 hypothetical protein [Phycisphaerae bacterium]
MKYGSVIASIALGVLALCPSGCTIGMDFFNPNLLRGLGIDPAAVDPPSGTVIVMFVNDTNGLATFHAYEIPNLAHPEQGARNFSVEVQPRGNDNEVLDCPLGMFGLGSLGAGFAVSDETAVDVVIPGGGGTSVPYAGQPLFSPDDFKCGDMILVQLTADGALLVQLLPS